MIDIIEIIALDNRDRSDTLLCIESSEHDRKRTVLPAHMRTVKVEPIFVVERRERRAVMIDLPFDDALNEKAVGWQVSHLYVPRRDTHTETLGFARRRFS